MQIQFGKILLQPEKPNATLEYFEAPDELVEKSNLGKLFIMVEINSKERGLKEKIKELIKLVQNDYYSSPVPNIETSLENTCQNLNLNFVDIIAKPEMWYKKINILIGVVDEKILTFSQMGNFSGYLIRNNKISSILNTQHQDETEELFSQLTTGEIKPGDVVILSDYALFDFFSLEKINKVAGKLNAEQSAYQFENLILESEKAPNLVSLIIKYEQSPVAINKNTSQTQKYLEDFYGSRESMQQLENLQERTGRTLTASLWPNISKLKKIFKNKKAGIQSKNKKSLKLPQVKKEKKVKLNNRLGQLKELKIPQLKLPNFKSNSTKIIAVLLIVFIASLVFMSFNQKVKSRNEFNQNILDGALRMRDQADAALIYQDKEKAAGLLDQALIDLEQVDKNKKKWSEKYEEVKLQVVKLYNKVNQVYEVELESLVDLSNISINSINNLFKDEGQLIALIDSDKVYKISPQEKSFSEYFTESDLKLMTFLEEDEGLVILKNNNKFYWRKDNGSLEELNITLAVDSSLIDMKIYGDRLYYLDENKGIYKISNPTAANPAINVWYNENKDLISATDYIIVDGNIWLIDGKITKLFRGKEESFEITKLKENLGISLEIYSESDWDYLYVIDKAHARLLIIDKTGVVIKQFLNENLEKAESLIVNDDQNLAWFNVGGQIWQINLKEE